MKNYYELLGVSSSAPAQDIKQAFRREIARYHPDKVQHLGVEFQQLASVRAAELTQAYQVLMDEALRADYDRQLAGEGPETAREASIPRSTGRAGSAVAEPPPAAAESRPASDVRGAPPDAAFTEERARRDDVVRKAVLDRFEGAVKAALGDVENLTGRGFDVALVSKPRRGLLRKPSPPVCVCGRFVSRVDGAVVQETWPLAAKLGAYENVYVFLMGAGFAPPREIGSAIAEQRRKAVRATASKVVIVPVDARDWEALVPSDAPATVKQILEKLRATA